MTTNADHSSKETLPRDFIQEEETIKRIRLPEKISIKRLVVSDGSITLLCPNCCSTWVVNIFEEAWIYEEEAKCRNCMRQSGVRTTAEFPLKSVYVISTLGKPKT